MGLARNWLNSVNITRFMPNQPTSQKGKTNAFTLLEIMVIVAIVAMMAALATPSLLRARQRAQAAAVKQELRVLDSAASQFFLENSRNPASLPTGDDLKKFTKRGTRLYTALDGAGATVLDRLGNPITIPSMDNSPVVAEETFAALSGAANAEFWAPYYVAP